MDIDLRAPGLDRIVGTDAPLDQIAHGLNFGEGPVWDRRNKRFLWTDIIGDTIYEWAPGVGRKALVHPSMLIEIEADAYAYAESAEAERPKASAKSKSKSKEHKAAKKKKRG